MTDKPTLAQQIEYMSNRVELLKKGTVLGFSHNVELSMCQAILETLEKIRDDRPLFISVLSGDMGPCWVKEPPGVEIKSNSTHEPIAWLNGWPIIGETVVLMGTGMHCIGCGKRHGTTTVAYSGDIKFPDKAPEWPFKEVACPICNLKKQVSELRDKSEDKLAARAIKLMEKNRET